MADEELNPKMRINPLWYQGWDYDDGGTTLGNIQGDLDMKGHAIVNLKAPQNQADAVNKKYVDDAIAAGGGGKPLVAANITSVGTGQIQALNVQDAINEISREAAFTDAQVTFQEDVVFNKVVKLAAGASPTAPEDLATVKKVSDLIAAIKAVNISVDQTTPLNNLTATDVQVALQQADDLFDELSDLIVENTSLVGLYDAATNQVVKVFGGAAAGGLSANQPLPAAIDENKNMYVFVTVAGTGTAPAPTEQLLVGDLIISNGQGWSKIATGKVITASLVPVTAIPGVNGTNVQEILESLNTSVTNADMRYVKKDGGQLISALNANNQKITGLADPTDPTDVANKKFVEAQGLNYVTKSNGQLTTDLDANNQKIVNLQDPGQDQDAVNFRYAKATYVTKSNGQLTTDLDANQKKIVNLGAPQANTDAIRKIDLTDEVAKYVKKAGGQLDSDLDANTKKIINLADGADAGDAINKGQLDQAINTLKGQLTGKLTFVGTYNANTNTLVHVNSTVSTQYPVFSAGNALPPDNVDYKNYFLIVTVKGTGVAPAPTVALNVGDLIYSSGNGWGTIPLGATTAAVNVSVDPIAQLPGVSDVQAALNTLATRPAGAATATTTSFNPAGSIVATNVQTALEELDTKKAADDQVVKLTGDQVVAGTKKFTSPRFDGRNSFSMIRARDADAYFEWKESDTANFYAYIGYGSSRKGALQFVNNRSSSGNPAFFEFNQVCRYNPLQNVSDSNDLVPKNYVDNKFVDKTSNQEVDGTKTFLDWMKVGLTGIDSAFNFLDYEANGKVAPQASLIETRADGTHAVGGSIPRVLGFSFVQLVDIPIRAVHFVLKYKNPNGNYFFFRISYQPDVNPNILRNVECFVRGNKLRYISCDGTGAPQANDTGVILEGIANATADSHAINRGFANVNYVRTGGNVAQFITGVKTFGTQIRAGYGGGYLRLAPEDNSTKTLYFGDTTVGANNKFHLDLERKSQLKNLVDPANNYDAAHKKYVDDAVSRAGGFSVEKLTDVNVTASIASLAGKGTLTFSSRFMRDAATKDVLSALFGMKLTLTAPWNPGDSTTPTLLNGCQISGEEYFKGLPVPVDATLQGGSFKTVAQIQLIRVVPTSGVNLPQTDSPLHIGRIVCQIDGGNTKFYAAFKYNSDIPIPAGTGAFFIVRYEGLPTLGF